MSYTLPPIVPEGKEGTVDKKNFLVLEMFTNESENTATYISLLF